MPSPTPDVSAAICWWARFLADWFDGTPRQWVLLDIAKQHASAATPYRPGRRERFLLRLMPILGYPVLARYFRQNLPLLAPFVESTTVMPRDIMHAIEMPVMGMLFVASLVLTSHLAESAKMALVMIVGMITWVVFAVSQAKTLNRQYREQLTIREELASNGPEEVWETATSLSDGLSALLPPATVSACLHGVAADPAYWMTLEKLPSLRGFQPIPPWPWQSLLWTLLWLCIVVWLTTAMMGVGFLYGVVLLISLATLPYLLPRRWWPSYLYRIGSIIALLLGALCGWLAIS